MLNILRQGQVWLTHYRDQNPMIFRLILIGLVTLLGFGLRMYSAVTMLNDYDEDEYIIAAHDFRQIYDHGSINDWPNVKENDEHPPLVKMLYGLTLDADELRDIPQERVKGGRPKTPLPHDSILNGRLQSVLWGTLTVFLIASINPLAGLLLALNSIHVHYSSVTYLDSLPAFLTAFSVFAYWRAISANPLSKRWLILSGIALGIGVAGKYPYAIIGFVIVFHALYFQRANWQKMMFWLFIWGGLSLIAFFIFNPYLWTDPLNRLEYQLTFHQDYASDRGHPVIYKPLIQLIDAPSHLWHVMENRVLIAILHIADFVMLAGAIVGIGILLRQRMIWGWWLILGFVFLMVWPTQWVQHKMIIMVPYSIAASYGWLWLLQQFRLWRSRHAKQEFSSPMVQM